jgi:hypothetical protein
MKVLDLACGQRHVFEGWFASEADFQTQRERGLIQCPLCNDACITKKLSAPRLNFGASSRLDVSPSQANETLPLERDAIQSAWLAVARRIIATTDDVGEQFAEEARKIHYGEAQERGIRGQATPEEKEALIEEGIEVVSLPLPLAIKGPLQ